MIVKRNLSPKRVLEYVAGPMAWATLWAIAAPVAFTVTDDERIILPFPVVATLGAALAIFVAFRNNSAFARWNDARAAWQTVLVASRTLTRQIIASTRHAAASGTITGNQATEAQRQIGGLVVEFAWTLAAATRPRRLIELFALVAPFALLGLVPGAIWLTTPLALVLAGTYVVLAVTGAANDEPFANRVTDVPIDTICTQLEHDVLTAIGHPDPPQLLQPIDGYLW